MSYINRPRTVEAWDREGGLGPPGAVWLEKEQGWNFTLHSRHATKVNLLFHSATNFVDPVFELQLNPLTNKTARIWHCFVPQTSALEKNRHMFRFFQYMIAFRKARPWIGSSRFWREDVHWYGPDGPVDLGYESRTLAYCLLGQNPLYVMINAFWEPVVFRVQEERNWKRLVDTSRDELIEQPVASLTYKVEPRSIVVLESTA